jgi:3-hydroxyisobutyrate dehydrogenase
MRCAVGFHPPSDDIVFSHHALTDLSIALEESARMNLALPGLALANQLYLSVKAQGHGLKGTHALALALEHLNGMSSNVRK